MCATNLSSDSASKRGKENMRPNENTALNGKLGGPRVVIAQRRASYSVPQDSLVIQPIRDALMEQHEYCVAHREVALRGRTPEWVQLNDNVTALQADAIRCFAALNG